MLTWNSESGVWWKINKNHLFIFVLIIHASKCNDSFFFYLSLTLTPAVTWSVDVFFLFPSSNYIFILYSSVRIPASITFTCARLSLVSILSLSSQHVKFMVTKSVVRGKWLHPNSSRNVIFSPCAVIGITLHQSVGIAELLLFVPFLILLFCFLFAHGKSKAGFTQTHAPDTWNWCDNRWDQTLDWI